MTKLLISYLLLAATLLGVMAYSIYTDRMALGTAAFVLHSAVSIVALIQWFRAQH